MRHPTFACLQHSKKLHPDFDDALEAVMRSVPAARVMLLEGARTHIPRWRRRGIDVDRLVFQPRTTRDHILALVAEADAFLDTYPWGGGVTVLEALAVCTPVIVLPAKTTVLQLARGHLKAAGLIDDLVAIDVQDYARIARRLANDATFRMAMRRKACTSRVFDDDGAVDEWAMFLRRAIASATAYGDDPSSPEPNHIRLYY